MPIVGDCREVIVELIEAVATERAEHGTADLAPWWSYLDNAPRPTRWVHLAGRRFVSPEYVIERIGQIAGSDAVYAAGVGQHDVGRQFIRTRSRALAELGGLARWATRCRPRWRQDGPPGRGGLVHRR